MPKKPTKTPRHGKKPGAKPEISQTKQSTVLALLRRMNGASIADIVEATDWQPHSVRGFMSGALKKRLQVDVVSEKDTETGERRYYVAPIKS